MAAGPAVRPAGREDGVELRDSTAVQLLARCLRDVLVAASGNPAWLDDPRVDRLAPDPGALLQDLAYLDRMSDQPRHDEQGTRDRPYDLIAWFDPAHVDALLAQLGDRPWRGERPALGRVGRREVEARGGAGGGRDRGERCCHA